MKLNEVVPWGRSFAEYQLMFNLSAADLKRRILGCGDGPASFNTEMTQKGHSVVSIDPVYQFSAEQIRQRVRETYETIISQLTYSPRLEAGGFFRSHPLELLSQRVGLHQKPCDY